MKQCEQCGHTQAAHVDGLRCALCGCTPRRTEYVQQKLTFRSALPTRVTPNTRKR